MKFPEDLKCEHELPDGTLCGEFASFGFMDYDQDRRVCFCIHHVDHHTKEMMARLKEQKDRGLW